MLGDDLEALDSSKAGDGLPLRFKAKSPSSN
jgi:hypothetical protein